MRRSNVALPLQPSLLEEAKRLAASEAGAFNQLINVAVAENTSALRTEDYFRERAAHANLGKANLKEGRPRQAPGIRRRSPALLRRHGSLPLRLEPILARDRRRPHFPKARCPSQVREHRVRVDSWVRTISPSNRSLQ
jgi:hypothetical protein